MKPAHMQAFIVPLKCVGSGGCFPVLELEKKYQNEVRGGGACGGVTRDIDDSK